MITNRLASLLLLAIGVTGCSKEETLPDTPDTARTAMTIRVTDGGYAASDKSAAETRAVENGYATEFTAGDRIGLYVVKPDGSYAHANIALTLTDNGDGTFAWTPPADTKLYYEGAETNYFAYYPYQPALTGKLVPSATDAAGFFANVMSEWTPDEDQSSYALYTAQDLMVGSGIASKQADGARLLALTMSHAMALVVIETPATKYTLSSDANYTWTAAGAPDTKFYGFTPYSPTGGTYRYLVKPAQSGVPDLYGSYTAKSGNTREYIIKQNNIAPANYAHYKVDGGITEKTHTLQVGDFYLKDGSLVAKDATLTDAQAAACIGIVLKAGRNLDGDWKDDCDYMLKGTTIQMSTIHGYVLALDDANNGKDCNWGLRSTIVGTNTEQYTGFYGYTNTNTIKAFATKNGNDLETAFPVTYYATEGYEKTNPAPDNTSGWFLPSAGQCKFWLDNEGVLLASVRKATGSDGYNWKDYYWSSSESGNGPAYVAWYLSFDDGYVDYGNKGDGNYVRSVLAF